MHTALWVLAATSLVGAVVSPCAHEAAAGERDRTPGLRIGEVARLAGTTPRTIRYYEEIGILPRSARPRVRAPRLYDARRSRAPQRGPAAQGAARAHPRRAQGAARGRGALVRRCARSGITRTRAPSAGSRCSARRSAPDRPPARAGAAAPRPDRCARGRAGRQAPPRDAAPARAGRAVAQHRRPPAVLRARRSVHRGLQRPDHGRAVRRSGAPDRPLPGRPVLPGAAPNRGLVARRQAARGEGP